MPNIALKISGLKEMEKTLLKLAKEVGSKEATGIMTGAIRDGAKVFEEEIKANAPESTPETKRRAASKMNRPYNRPGFLKSRIKIRAITNRKGVANKNFSKNTVSLVRTGYFNVFYAKWLEYGNSKQPANPILRRAFLVKRGSVLKVINHRLAKRIELAHKRIARQQRKT